MNEQPTFVDQAFRNSGKLFGSAAEIVTNPARKVYESLSRLLKMRSPYKRSLQHA